MSSFSLDFDDDSVFEALGDDIEVTPKGGETVIIKAPFAMVHDAEELIDRIDNDYPHLEDVQPKHLHLFKKDTIVRFNGETYEFQKMHKKDANTTEIELRNPKKTW